MRLKEIIALASMLWSTTAWGAELPKFSSGEEEHWYYIVFSNSDAALQDLGNGRNVMSMALTGGKENQQWKLEGNAESFILLNKTGNAATFDGFLKSSDDMADAARMSLEISDNAEYADSWEIAVKGVDNGYDRLNQQGGGGTGRSIIGYTSGDASNALKFYEAGSIFVDPAATAVAEYTVIGADGFVPSHRHTLWYTQPATSQKVENPWMEYALPIGNGEFGGMVYGGIHREQIQFNDKSVWTGSTVKRGSYQNFGDLLIEDISGVFDEGAVTEYVRSLDMSDATARVSYASPDGSVTYGREYISSYPDRVMAVRLTSSQPGAISVKVMLRNNIRKGIVGPRYSDGGATFEGSLDLIDFKAGMRVLPKGGTMTTHSDNVEITGADEVVVILAGATNFDQHSNDYIYDAAEMRRLVDTRLDNGAAKGWDAIYADHKKDYTALFDRMTLSIDGTSNDRPTDEMVKYYNGRRTDPSDPAALMLEELYFTFGRYLLISSSRGMDTPANLQGIWNNSDRPAWQSDIHSNINVQMNYWPAEVTNLSEMHIPYLNYIHSMALEHEEWQEYARRSGQTKGWTCFTQNNIFGHSDYAENYVIANAWYTSHLWKHYLYTLDGDFLREKALPVMISCCEFWMERLAEASDGTLVAPQEWSPEHGPDAEDGTAHAQQIIYELFDTTLQAIKTLGETANVDSEFLAELNDRFSRLDKGLAIETYTGDWGETLNGVSSGSPILREWKTSAFTAGENGHRHQSHLMCLYPFGQVTPGSEYFDAAVNSLRLRGDVSTGWSLGWKLCLWARALDGEHAHTILHNALRHATSYGQSSGAGGIYYNLLDSHAPFQIDGNFGVTAGVAEMLLQSYGGTLRLLPALPALWRRGSCEGLCAEYGFEVDQNWDYGYLTKAVVTSGHGRRCRISYEQIAKAKVTDIDGNEIEVTKEGDDCISFDTEAGGRYVVTPHENLGVERMETPDAVVKFDGSVVSVSGDVISMRASTIDGVVVAETETGAIDLGAFAGMPLVVRVITDRGVVVRKVMPRH